MKRNQAVNLFPNLIHNWEWKLNVDNLLENALHFPVATDDVGKLGHLAAAPLQLHQLGHVAEGGYHAEAVSPVVPYHGDGEIDPALFAGFGGKGQRVFQAVHADVAAVAERAALATEGSFEDVVAILAQDFFAGVAGDALGFGIEKIDTPLHVVGDDALF